MRRKFNSQEDLRYRKISIGCNLLSPRHDIGEEEKLMSNSTFKNIQAVKNSLVLEGIDPEKYFPSCVGCGHCCIESTCVLGIDLFGRHYPCLALHWDGQRYRCRLAEDFPERLYIGVGCCSPLNSWRKEVRIRDANVL